jgi:hypothetical protein
VRWVGKGSELWRVRVDLFVTGAERLVDSAAVARSLESLLTERDEDLEHRDSVSVDRGLGIEKRPVVGLLFWVGADNVGQAATVAVETALRAGADQADHPPEWNAYRTSRGRPSLG